MSRRDYGINVMVNIDNFFVKIKHNNMALCRITRFDLFIVKVVECDEEIGRMLRCVNKKLG